jgi:amidase
LTEVFFEDALKEAAKLDEYYQAHRKLIGPLHGVPVTLKDQFDIEGADSTIGYVSRALQPAKEDAALVKILKDLGAIVLAKTNLPQSIMVDCSIINHRYLI